jgi:hypothetical protein
MAKGVAGRCMLVEPALGHDLRLPVVLFLAEALDVIKQHLRVGGQDRTVDMSARIPKRGTDQRLRTVQQRLPPSRRPSLLAAAAPIIAATLRWLLLQSA